MIYAMDIDLGKCFCASEVRDNVLNAHPHPYDVAFELKHGDQLLVEVSSPQSFVRGVLKPSIAYPLAKWALWNIAQAAGISNAIHDITGKPMLVAPSDRWTKGFEVKTRHAMAKATAKNKDLRECQAMIWSYKHHPDCWLPMAYYLESIK
jgi:hypothetical protein